MDEANYLISRVQSADIGDGSGVPNCDVRQTFHECHTFSLNPHLKYDALYKIKIDSVCDYLHDIVNTGHWSEVDHSVRQTFSAVSLIKVGVSITYIFIKRYKLKVTKKCLRSPCLFSFC